MLTSITGINWGDEGKGRMVDLLSQDYDIVARYQGGDNAGHTVKTERGKFVLNLLSSGMMGSSYDSVDAYLADANDSIKSITQQALLMQAVAEKMGFKCDTATMNADFGRYYGTTDPSQYVSAYGENYIKMNVLQSDVMQNLIDNVKYE